MNDTSSHRRTLAKKGVFSFFAILVSLGLIYSDKLKGLDNLFYDQLIQTMQRPAPDDIVIIGIDDQSLQTLGRWPWSRKTHAELIDQLTQAGAKVIGFDLLFSEPDLLDPEADRLLATAIKNNGRIILPVAYTRLSAPGLTEILPLPILSEAAAGLGHVEIPLDEDGVHRKLFLKGGLGGPYWSTFALAMLDQVEAETRNLFKSSPPEALPASPYLWFGAHPALISFAGPPGHFKTYSYIDILEGRIDAAHLQHKFIFVGATASGLASGFSTPVSESRSQMSGVELNANVLDALRQDLIFQPLHFNLYLLLTALLVVLPVVFYFHFSPRAALFATSIELLLILLISASFLSIFHQWFAPATSLLVVGFSAPLLSWIRLEDMNRALFKEKERMAYQATHDALTQLPNRYLLIDRIHHAIQKAKRSNKKLALLFLDLDDFKKVNDAYGHSTGDMLLIKVVERLKTVTRTEDAFARLGGDEFIVVLENLHNEEIASEKIAMFAAQKILDTLKPAFHLHQHDFFISGSIGISLYPKDGEDPETLLKNADTAMYRAKDTGRNCFQFYTREMNIRIVNRLAMENDLRQAIKKGEFQVYYQLLVGVEKQITGVECLLRWNHPERGLIFPSEFVALAEEMGLILPIGEWVMRTACEQAGHWAQMGFPSMRIGVNLSALQFSQKNFTETVAEILHETALPPHCLSLEITESMIMKNVETAVFTLTELKVMGVHIAVDDFGTGYSSLSYLKSFPIDQLKIDQSFVRDVIEDANDAAISKAIIAMAHSMNLSVIAEGVETEAQAEFLKLNGCDELQGYHYCRPVTEEKMTEILMTGGTSCFS